MRLALEFISFRLIVFSLLASHRNALGDTRPCDSPSGTWPGNSRVKPFHGVSNLDFYTQPGFWVLLVEWMVRIGFALRVISRRYAVGTSLAWLSVILLVPFLGSIVYFLLAERRLGYRRAAWASELLDHYGNWLQRLRQFEYLDWHSNPDHDPEQLSRLITNAGEIPPLRGNRLLLMESAEEIFAAMIEDIRNAQHFCNLEFYIWEVGGAADAMAEALREAAARGVRCRVLVDAVGSRGFLKSEQAQHLREANVEVRAALPASLFRALLYRFDLRLHRKIFIVDQRVAYVGSQNMADPKLFQSGAGFGQWIDAMVRLEGPAVDALSMVFWEDWQLESLEKPSLDELPVELPQPELAGQAPVQVVPSGPGTRHSAIRQILLNAIYMADRKLVLTTPYFVPDEALQTALVSAAQRGVDVTILIPEKVNSIFVRLASRPFLRDLVTAGIKVAAYEAGMLHTKSIIIDEDTGMFGSLNLDPRSLHLNFEITLAIYDHDFCASLADLQREYLKDARIMTIEDLTPGSFVSRLLENSARLLAPLL